MPKTPYRPEKALRKKGIMWSSKRLITKRANQPAPYTIPIAMARERAMTSAPSNAFQIIISIF